MLLHGFVVPEVDVARPLAMVRARREREREYGGGGDRRQEAGGATHDGEP
jgi:hypothetical protein